MEPEAPLLVVPDWNVKLPLTPEMPASTDFNNTEPLDFGVL